MPPGAVVELAPSRPPPAGTGPDAGLTPREDRAHGEASPAGPGPDVAAPASAARLELPPYDFAAATALSRELGVGHVLAQVLVRRGYADPAAAAAFLAADERHEPERLAGLDAVLARIEHHCAAGSRITVHGDYDVDGVCATAIMVGALRRAGATVDWYLPSRDEDGYGLSAATVDRLAARGTGLLITVDCAVTAVAEVARAQAAGIEVIVTDHHQPRRDGELPAAPLLHPRLCGYPCPDLCATAVAHKLAHALDRRRDPAAAPPDLELVALATVADVVPLVGENRALVRAGLRAMPGTARPGLRALMRVARVDPSRVDAHALAFRLAPRMNAAGRLERPDAALELLLTGDEERAAKVAAELDEVNHRRREVETRILFEAEAQLAQSGERPAYVLAGEDWHPGVIGIVAARLVERHHRPVVLVALDGDQGVGSGRSIPAFDLLAGLDAAAEHLERHGGHRAAAGLEVGRERLEDLRSAFEQHAERTLAPQDLVPVRRVDAIVPGDALGLDLCEELERLAPFGAGNPPLNLLLPAATLSGVRTMGEGRHIRFTVAAGGVRARAVGFGMSRLPVPDGALADATFALERNEWNGAVEPRLVLRDARPCAPGPVTIVGEPGDYLGEVLALVAGGAAHAFEEGERTAGGAAPSRTLVDRRGNGLAGVIADAVATGEPVLVACADAHVRLAALRDRLGGFDLVRHAALARRPGLAPAYRHVIVLDPPVAARERDAARAGEGFCHLAWGEDEVAFARRVLHRDFDLRPALVELYRALRERRQAAGAELEQLLAGDPQRPRPAEVAARLVSVLAELGLATVDPSAPGIAVTQARRTSLERSPTFRACRRRLGDGLELLGAPAAARAA